jgi:Flp pilus assembly protein CpaB
MKKIIILLLSISIIGLLSAGYTIFNGSNKKEIKIEKKIYVLIYTEDVDRGARFEPQKAEWKQWPRDSAINYTNTENKDEIIPADYTNKIFKQNIIRNTPISSGVFFAKDEINSMLSSALGENMFAMTINVRSDTGGSGFIQAEDYVDILVTYDLRSALNEVQQNNSNADNSNYIKWVTETVVSGAKVIASGNNASTNKSGSRDSSKKVETLTVELSKVDVEKVTLAKSVGDLSVILRSVNFKNTQPKNEKESPGVYTDKEALISLRTTDGGEEKIGRKKDDNKPEKSINPQTRVNKEKITINTKSSSVNYSVK